VNKSWEAVCYVSGDDARHASVKELAENDRGQSGNVKWAGFAHSYFLAAMAPRNRAEEQLACSATGLAERDGAMEMTLFYPEITIKDGDPSYTRELTGYFGPKFMDRLESVSGFVDYDPELDAAVDLGMLSFICRPLLWLLKAFYGFVGNWGIAIILLTLVVQAITLPWTTKSMRSMKAMAKLRPHMEKLKEKYPDDKQRQQVEMMNLYKAHKINPLAGCLPMVLQMPIWFALYRSLSVAAELYQVPFIPGWLDDLTSPDPYYVMPVLLLGGMFLQTKLQPNPVESMQQKIMMYGMPLMFGFFSLFFPSGLTLYILTNTILRTSHQVYLNRTEEPAKPEPEPQKASAKDDSSDESTSSDGNGAQAQTARGPQQKSTGQKTTKKKSKKSRKKTGGRAAKA
jgi:YidC/Oxa1 family membrane protein insertase